MHVVNRKDVAFDPVEIARANSTDGHAGARQKGPILLDFVDVSAVGADKVYPTIGQLLQGEPLVDYFQAGLCAASRSTLDPFRSVAEVACAWSHVPTPMLDAVTIVQTSNRLARLKESWVPAPVGHGHSFAWFQ